MGVATHLSWTVPTVLFCEGYSDKRYREHPRRELKIFMLDISKQGFSAGLTHIINIIIAVLFSEWEQDDPCVKTGQHPHLIYAEFTLKIPVFQAFNQESGWFGHCLE
jgi:hypothetical protein